MCGPHGGGVAALGKEVVSWMDEQERSVRRPFGRKRRANVRGGRMFSHRVRVTAEEEAALQALAVQHGVGVVRLMVEAALSVDKRETPTQRREAMAELFAIKRLLAAVSNNVNQIAKATNATGEYQDGLEGTLLAVRRVAGRIDEAIEGLIEP